MNEFSLSFIIDEINKYPGWELEENKLIKNYEFKNFNTAVSFLIKVSLIAEKIQHHPELHLHSWNNLRITTTSHDKNAITDRDFQLVKLIEENLSN